MTKKIQITVDTLVQICNATGLYMRYGNSIGRVSLIDGDKVVVRFMDGDLKVDKAMVRCIREGAYMTTMLGGNNKQ
jgi:hypothetical protein